MAQILRLLFLGGFYLSISSALAQHKLSLGEDFKNSRQDEQIRYIISYLDKKVVENQIDSVEAFLEKIERYAKVSNKDSILKELAHIHNIKPSFTENNPANRIQIYRRLLEKYKKEENLYRVAICQHYMGQNQFVLGNYAMAFENLLKAFKTFEKIGFGHIPEIGKYLHDLALDYYYFKNYDKVIATMKIALGFPKFNNNLDMQRYNTLGMAYLRKDELDSAFVYLETALNKAKEYENPIWIGITSGNLGMVFEQQGKFKEALNYYKNYYRYTAPSKAYPEIAKEACLNLASIYMKIEAPQQAFNFLNEAKQYLPPPIYEFGEQQQFEITRKNYYQLWHQYYIYKQNYFKALQYKDSLTQAQQLENQKYNAALIKLSQNKLDLREQKNQLIIQEQQKTNMELTYSIIVLSVFIMAVIGFSLYYITRLNKKREKYKIESELKSAQANMKNLVRKTNEKNKLIEKFTVELRKFETHRENKKHEVNKAIAQLYEARILTDEDWIKFKKDFKKLYPNFTKKIISSSRQLTQAEVRYLMLIKIGMNHKEMAQCLGISSGGIRMTWNRLRKKLDMSPEDTPQNVIEQIESFS